MTKTHVRILCAGFLASLTILCCHRSSDMKDFSIRKVLSVGGPADDIIYMIAGLATDGKGNVFVLDSMDCSIKKIDKSGRLIKRAGQRGQGPGEFMAPHIIKLYENTLFVYDLGLSCIHVLDEDLNYLSSSHLPFPITDMEALSSERLFVHSFILANPLKISVWDLKENPSGQSNSVEDIGNALGKGLKFAVDEDENIFVCSVFEDLVEKYDRNHQKLWSQSLMGGIKAKTETRNIPAGMTALPLEMIYKDIELDMSGRVFVLLGHIGPNRSRKVFILDGKSGRQEGSFFLPEPSHFIHIDFENNLYARINEGTGYAKYTIAY